MKNTKFKISYEDLSFYILLIFPIIFVVGSAPMNILLIISSILLFIISFKNNDWTWIRSKIFLTYIVFILYLLISNLVFVNDHINSSIIIKIVGNLRFIFFAYFISIVFGAISEKKKSFFINFNITFILFVIVDILIQKFFGKDIFGYTGGMCSGSSYTFFDLNILKEVQITDKFYCQRFAGPFDQEFIAGSFLVFIGIPIFGFKYLTYPFKKNNYILFFIFLLLNLTVILITGDRSPMISYLIILFLFFIFEENYRKYLIPISALVLITLLITVFVNINVYERYVSVGKSLLLLNKKSSNISIQKNENINKSLKQNFYNTQWGAHYLSAIEMFKEKPIIGNGYKSFKNKCKKYDYINSTSVNTRCSNHPHNYIIQLLAETGIIGTSLFMIFIISIFIKVNNLKKIKNKSLFIFMILILFSYLFPFKPGGSIFSSINNFFLFYILGWILYLTNINANIKIKI